MSEGTTHYYGDDCPMGHYTSQFFITPGIIAERIHEQAAKYREEGKASVVHYHSNRESCNDECTRYHPH